MHIDEIIPPSVGPDLSALDGWSDILINKLKLIIGLPLVRLFCQNPLSTTKRRRRRELP